MIPYGKPFPYSSITGFPTRPSSTTLRYPMQVPPTSWPIRRRLLALHPNVVTVWVGLSDLEAGVSPAEFGSQLQEIVAPLRALNAQVLLANMEPITHAVAYQTCAGVPGPSPDSGNFRCFVDRRFAGDTLPPADTTNAVLAAYDAQVAAVAQRDGAVLVNIDAAMSRSATGGASPFSGEDLDLSTTGHALAARLFVSAWRSTRTTSNSK